MPCECVACPHACVEPCIHWIHTEITFFNALLASMARRTKKVAQKHPRHDRVLTPPPEIELTELEHQWRFDHLLKLKFGQSCHLNWDTLKEIRLANEVRDLVDVVSWDRLLTIRSPVWWDVTLEVLSSFFFDHSMADTDFDKEDTIWFQAFS